MEEISISNGKPERDMLRYINLKLRALGQPIVPAASDSGFLEIADPLLRNFLHKDQLMGWPYSPVDARIQGFLNDYLKDICPDGAPRLPADTFALDRPGMARVLSLPHGKDFFSSPYLRSYRLHQGVLHNPINDRRTTQGVFHIVEGGLPIPEDKIAVPKTAFAKLLAAAYAAPKEALTLPFTGGQQEQASMFVSLLMRPVVCPATGKDPVKSMEIRFFAPGSLVSNLDFVEGIFGNAGDPFLPDNDAALDVEHWTGHTGCVILAPHLIQLKKKDLGLPRQQEATERQRRDGMCWTNEEELYNGGKPFKIACRDHRGIMITLIADNYYGYCKKEIKTQISYSANLFGLAEEEHAGGALSYATYVLGQEFYADRSFVLKSTSFEEAIKLLGDRVELKPGRYAVDRRYADIFYVPENSEFNVREGCVRWKTPEGAHSLPLRPTDTFILPSGYKVSLEKQAGGRVWRLIGSRPEGTFCHKPSTVSGGGKSEISKSIAPMIKKGQVYVKDFQKDMDRVAEIISMDFSKIFRQQPPSERAKRPFLSSERSLGSVIMLLTPSPEYTDEYNAWLRAIPQTIRQLVFIVKRYYQPEWGDRWRDHFGVEYINGYLGHELKFQDMPLLANYLRVGYNPGGTWRMYKVRPDFHPADKVQMEDDITASVVVPEAWLCALNRDYRNPSVKLVENCEALLFQRPDDAALRGVDHRAEADIASHNVFLTNFEPLNRDQVRHIVDRVAEFDEYTEPMKRLLEDFLKSPKAEYVVASDQARLVDGKPSKNPRYLQKRPDHVHHQEKHIVEMGARLYRAIPADRPAYFPVRAVLAGRRNNPANRELGIPPLAVFNPIHYQELPELFMDFISSLTGKSPSTTGFGSEGALTKAPFNAVWPVVDMNNALVSFILTGYAGFTSAAGHVGPKYKVDHDLSMLVPEIWCRMEISERDPNFLIKNGYLEKVNDLEYKGRKIPASRLGYRITARFADRFLGRIFETPGMVFTEEILRPETQDLDQFAEGVEAIAESHARVALQYFKDGSIEAAVPPLKALLHIMAHGHYMGSGVDDPKIRSMFSLESLLLSDWYKERLIAKQQRDKALWSGHIRNLEDFQFSRLGEKSPELDVENRLKMARARLSQVSSADYIQELKGTIGADPLHLQLPAQTA